MAFGVIALTAATLTGCGSKAAAPTAYGGLPSYLPTTTILPDGVLSASEARPALTSQGDGVRVQEATGASVLVTVTGPDVPGEGLPYQTAATTCTWTVTLTAATATVPIVIADFTGLDHLGTVYHPALVPGEASPPPSVGPGQTVTFQLRSVMQTGEGLIRWAPNSDKVLASWDFTVETD
jgi:hypothetical protein